MISKPEPTFAAQPETLAQGPIVFELDVSAGYMLAIPTLRGLRESSSQSP